MAPEHTILPAEIITEILYLLPAKSVGRFRCVSKSWLSQLTHPNFIKIHLNNNNTFSLQNHLIFKTPYTKRSIIEGSLYLHSHPLHSREVIVTTPTKFDLQLDNKPYRVDVCGSCDGLVLVRIFCNHLSEIMVVINPTTKECLQLPEINHDNFYDSTENTYEYDDEGSSYGFGYDSVTDDYKVVSLTHFYYLYDDGYCARFNVYVYSLRNKTMKLLNDSPYCYATSYGVFFNGFIHWIKSTMEDDDLRVIATFSLADERFSKVPFPNVTDTLKAKDCQLLVFGGKLSIFIIKKSEVWLMNEYGVTESWTKILLHGINKVPICKPECCIKPLVFDDHGKILVAYADRMMVYEVEKANFTETVCVWNPEKFCIAGFYVESLVSPKLSKEEEDDGYDLWKAKHREEKLRADKLEEELTHALSKQQFLTYHLEENEATIQSNLVKIQALERRTMEQDDEIESLKARLALADEERRKAIAALQEMN